MKLKTSELTGVALDWAVAKCVGWNQTERWMEIFMSQHAKKCGYNYSLHWDLAGQIIERECINLWREDRGNWCASKDGDDFWADTPLVATMRCYVASKLGDEVEVPDELQPPLNPTEYDLEPIVNKYHNT